MSDIPLHSIRKGRRGYAPLSSNIDDLESDTPTPRTNGNGMHTSVAAAAARRGGRAARRRDAGGYRDEPEEEQGLLGADVEGGSDDGEGPEEPERPSARHSHSAKHGAVKDKSRTIPFRPPGMCLSNAIS